MRRKHPDGLTRPGDERCRLNRPHARFALHFQDSPGEDWTLFHVLNNDALLKLIRNTASTLHPGSAVPEVYPPLRKSPLGHDTERGRYGIYELNGAKVSAGKVDRDIDYLDKDFFQIVPGYR